MLARRLLLAALGGGTFTVTMTDLGITNVKDHGALGDGTTDDTAAISDSISAMASGGVLYFPPGTYKTSGGFSITVPCSIIGFGGGGGTTLNYGGPGAAAVGSVSKITCTSASAVLFTVSASAVRFEGLGLVCTATATSGSAGIKTVSGGGDHAEYVGLTVSGFYTDIEHDYGREYSISRCWILDWVFEGLHHANAAVTDEGEVNIVDCHFISQRTVSDPGSAIGIATGGGIRIANSQFVGIPECPYMVKVIPTAATSNLVIIGNTFEGWGTNAIYVSGGSTWYNIIIVGNELQGGGSSYHEAIFLNNVSRVTIGHNSMVSTVGSHPAITLSNIVHAVVTGNYWEGYSAFSGGSSQTDVNATANYS